RPRVRDGGGMSDTTTQDRDALGRVVREAWIAWAREQPSPKPSWLVPYDELSEADREADRRIGDAVAAVVRRAMEAPGEVCGKRFGRLRCDWVLRHLYERGVDVAVAESVEAAFAVAALVRPELEAPGDTGADAEIMWYHWTHGSEDLALACLR